MTYGDLQISQCENLRDWNYINECNHAFSFEFTYVHELQLSFHLKYTHSKVCHQKHNFCNY